MANPLSGQGWSDRDYQGMVGTLVGEAAARGNLTDYQAIADVVANRLNDPAYVSEFGRTVAAQTMNPAQFSAWSAKEKAANFNAKAGFAAAISPAFASRLSPAMQERVTLAKQAVDDVFVNGKARGLTQNATAYHNPKETAKLGTGGWHRGLEREHGAITIGDHRFTGAGLRPDQPFDNVTYNGQLGIPDTALPDFNGVAFASPIGSVDFMGDLPDISAPFDPAGYNPVDYAAPLGPDIGGFDWGGPQFNDFSTDPASAGFSLGDPSAPNFDDVALNSYPDITSNTAFDPMTSFNPVDAAPVNVSDVDVGSYPEITAGLFGTPSTDFSVDVAPAPVSGLESFGPAMTEAAPKGVSGFSQGFESDIPTPDFNAPSLSDRLAERTAQDRIDNFVSHDLPGISYGNIDKMNADLMAELAPSPTPSFSAPATQAISTAAPQAPSSIPQGDIEQPTFSPPTQERAPSLPAASGFAPVSQGALPSAVSPAPSGFGGLPSVGDVFSGITGFGKGVPDQGFMDAMANPQIAANYSPGILDGWTGQALKGAALGALTGGPFGALVGGGFGALNLDGRLASAFSNQFGGFPGASWDSYDPSTMGYGFGFNDRGERSHTGVNDSGSASVGDGSYGSQSGRNDNNPQGIL